jgi:hypothetical protein
MTSTIPDMTIVINAFPDDHFVPEDSCLLGDRVMGTFGFCGALALLSSSCCCCCRGCHKAELTHTFNKHTVFGMCCPLKF